MLISPVVLVRLLSVQDFGRYREFLLYTTVLLSFAALGISHSLLRFIPSRPELKWRYVEQTVALTFASSVLVTGVALLLDTVLEGRVLGEFAWPAALYVLLFVNLDFWEALWLAERRSFAVLGYTTGRLIARMLTVITAAALSGQVRVIVWSLVCMEAVRLTISFISWRRRVQPVTADTTGALREQLSYCLPFGGSMVIASFNRSIGSLFVAKMMGPVALAHYAIGTYLQPVITVLRNSLSDVLLPEMVARHREPDEDRLLLFRRTTVVIAILLIGAAILLARFAEILVITLFSEEYRPAVAILQIYVLVFARESLDFGVPLRAINRTTPILRSNVVAIILNVGLVLLLLPLWGLMGAVIAFVLSRLIEGAYLGWQTMRAYQVPLSQLAPWKDLGKVVIAAALAAVVLYGDLWTEWLGLLGALLGGATFIVAFATMLLLFRVPEAMELLRRIRSPSAES
ncbi:oligosaccharide flippase family protein [Steroidobacter sp. S1-65]|uniref:Oligosaccharide flippase family protein n=2 Tax=Steroidobacter gossypii TaxID=2805490 RepID=A0ABS1WZC7_9GAMM|nr:oligosaccharide flippase family protein [Steroidobacter gossypii]